MKRLFLILLCLSPFSSTLADDAKPYLHASPEDVTAWRDWKFGLFVHWGPVSLSGKEISWSRRNKEIPVEVYDNFYKRFNPTRFRAQDWIDVAKSANMRYVVFTTKHHDGFCNFDTKLTDYKITSPECPYGRDVVKPLAEACREAGLKWGIYYSQPDWHHPDFKTERHANYIKYFHGQLRELLTNYGRTDLVWFDGLGAPAKDWDAEKLFKMIRELQPHVIINQRCGLPGDYDTPEQNIGAFQNDRPWETCMTLCTQWSWKPDDKMKSLKECLQTLVMVVGGDGNLLFNVGPMPDGRIEPRQARRLAEMGDWLRRHGQSIFGTRGGPFVSGVWGASTYRDNTIFVHILDWRGETLVLPPLKHKILGHHMLTGSSVEVQQTNHSVAIRVTPENRDPIDTIVALELDGPAAEEENAAARGLYSTQASATSFRKRTWFGVDVYGPRRAFDNNRKTYWEAENQQLPSLLTLDLGEPTTFSRALLCEARGNRVEQFELQQQVDGQWQTFAQGATIGPEKMLRFAPVTTCHVRLRIVKAKERPAIAEVQFFGE